MLKLSRFLVSRSPTSDKLFSSKISNANDGLWKSQWAGISTYTPNLGNVSGNIYVDYTIFKGKAGLSINPVLPTFCKTPTGNLRVEKNGCILLKFFPAIGERKYDFEKKQYFALSATELGSLISLAPGRPCEFFHDPNMKSSTAGQVRKSFSVTPLSEDSGGYFFSLTVTNSILKTNERFSVPVTKAEFAVMQTAFSFMLPHIMGWDQLTSQLPTRTSLKQPRQSEMRPSPDLEWDR